MEPHNIWIIPTSCISRISLCSLCFLIRQFGNGWSAISRFVFNYHLHETKEKIHPHEPCSLFTLLLCYLPLFDIIFIHFSLAFGLSSFSSFSSFRIIYFLSLLNAQCSLCVCLLMLTIEYALCVCLFLSLCCLSSMHFTNIELSICICLIFESNGADNHCFGCCYCYILPWKRNFEVAFFLFHDSFHINLNCVCVSALNSDGTENWKKHA